MYHEEKVIDGVLSWRCTPDGEWTPCTLKEITGKYIVLLSELAERRVALEKIADILDAL